MSKLLSFQCDSEESQTIAELLLSANIARKSLESKEPIISKYSNPLFYEYEESIERLHHLCDDLSQALFDKVIPTLSD